MHTPRTESLVVIDNVPAAPGVRLLTLTAPRHWSFRPGQVAELSTGPSTEGYFAIASAPWEVESEANRLVFLIKAEGSDSEPLMHLTTGAAITLRGPFGGGFELPFPVAMHDILFVTAGTAIAAIRSAVVEAIHHGASPRMTIVIGLRHAADLCFADEVVAWRERGIQVRLALSYGEADIDLALPLQVERGRVQAHLADLANADTHAFIAGSEVLEDDVTRVLVASGVEPSHIQRNYRPDGRGEEQDADSEGPAEG